MSPNGRPTGTGAHILERLSADKDAKDFEILVLAALEGPQELKQALDAQAKPKTQQQQQQQPQQQHKPQAAYFSRITVEGFRGIGKKADLEITPGPGLTLVVGRNGSGKSSFAEALELLLTKDTYRWMKRTKVWRDGWRNLHHKTASIEAECLIEGKKGATVIRQTWAEKEDLEDGKTQVQPHGEPKTDRETLGWDAPLATYRPFLSYNELGSLLDEGPSKLFDALAQILGLDDLTEAEKTLAEERTQREKAHKDCELQRKQIVDMLAPSEDPRAKALAAILIKKDWDAAQAEAALKGDQDSAAQPQLDALRKLAHVQGPTWDVARDVIEELKHNAKRQEAAKGTLANKSKELAEILDRAIHFHDAHGDGDCPVCGNKKALDKKWHDKKKKEAEDLKATANDAIDAEKQANAAIKKAKELPLPRLDDAPRTQLSEELTKAREAAKTATTTWQEHLSQPIAKMASGLDESLAPLTDAIDKLRTQAQKELQEKEDKWRPTADLVRTWLAKAQQSAKAAEAAKPLKAAEQWLKKANQELRTERFAPIKEKAQQIWNQLRMQSSVALDDVRLAGSSKQRKVELDVTVDGVEGAALGVMSQGELHALALSLFIPRATLPESPFRFIVIDDPVQSMDPARVDGLARVLQSAAKSHQVVVFTHDDRLPEAVRRLDVQATIVEVTRREGSLVECRESKDPVARYLDDARSLTKTQNLPPEAARRVIPGFCRYAIEAACSEVIRKRRLKNGLPHAEVERALERATTKQFVAMAIYDDVERTDDVLKRLNKEKPDYADVFRQCQEGAHEDKGVDTMALVRGVEGLTKWLRAQA